MAREEFDSANSIPKVETALGLLHGTTPKLEAAIEEHKRNNDSVEMVAALDRLDSHRRIIKQHDNLLGMLKSGEFDKHLSTQRDVQKMEKATPPRPTRESTPEEWDAHSKHVKTLMNMRAPIDRLMGSIPNHTYNALQGQSTGSHWSDKLVEDAQSTHNRMGTRNNG